MACVRVLFVTRPHLPEVGGAALTTHWLAHALQARGHEVAVFASQPSYRPPDLARDVSLGYLTIRSSAPARDVGPVMRSMRPDWVVVGGYEQRAARWAGSMLARASPARTFFYLHDLGCASLLSQPTTAVDRVAAVSRFLVVELARRGVQAGHLVPAVPRSRYRVRSSRQVALFVNPVPDKGLDIALGLARARPDISFAFGRCWHIGPGPLRALRRTARRLGNVEIRDPVSSGGRLFSDCRVLLVPSRYPEAWGRVVSEAQASGIPVIAAQRGGLPEATGHGGVLVPASAGPEDWCAALTNVWDDPRYYARLAAGAERHGRRAELRPEHVARRFEEMLA
jgi:glycosyltransferase involved in cell wall biosynthesis